MQNLSISRLALIASSALSLTLAANPALAQTEEAGAADNGGLTDIVVTAQRKSESLIDVPVAVTAVSSEVLQRSNITSLESAAAIVPFVTIARVSSGNGGFMSIRGIASTPQDAGAQQSVLTNIDYVLIGRGRLATMAMFDVGQVEVLKGPQALYYGKNTTAGVFSMTSNDPGRNFGGYIKGGYEFEAHQRSVDGAVDYPLGDTLRARVAGHYSKMRGFIYNAAQPIAYPAGTAYQPWINAGVTTAPGAAYRWGPNDEEIGGRLTLVYEPTSELTAKFKYTYGHTNNKGSGATAFYNPYCAAPTTKVTTYGQVDPNSDCNRDFRVSVGDLPAAIASKTPLLRDGVPYAYTNGHLASLNIDYQLADNLKLSSITGYYNVVFQGSGNNSPSVWAGVFASTRDTAWGLSQELRLASSYDGPVNFEIGAFLDRLHQDTIGASSIIPGPADPRTGEYITYSRLTNSTSRSYSAFGKINWEIVKDLTLSGGVRFTRYLLSSTDGNRYVNPNAAALLLPSLVLRPEGSYFVRTYKDKNYSPEVVLNWKPADRQTLYVSFKTGYKSGGFSYPSVLNTSYNDLQSGTPGSTRFAPEEAYSWEAGYKAELFDRKLRVELSAYHTTVINQQLSSFDPGTFSFIVRNAGKARVQGVELQVTAAPAEGLQVFGSVGYNDGKYLSFPGAQCSQVQSNAGICGNRGNPVQTQDLSGRVLPRAPKWAGNFGASYDMPLGMGMKLSLNGMGTFSSSYYSIDSLDPNTIQKSYVKWDAGIAVASEDDKWRLALQGRNLSNKYISVYSYDGARMSPYSYVAVPQRGRQVSLEATYRF